MADVQSDVTEPLKALANLSEGLASKNKTMKDGPPEKPDKIEGSEPPNKRPDTPSKDEKTDAYDKYKDDIDNAFDKFERTGNRNFGELATDIGQAVVDLGVKTGPAVVALFRDILSLGR